MSYENTGFSGVGMIQFKGCLLTKWDTKSRMSTGENYGESCNMKCSRWIIKWEIHFEAIWNV